MSRQLFTQPKIQYLFTVLLLVALVGITACAGSAPPEAIAEQPAAQGISREEAAPAEEEVVEAEPIASATQAPADTQPPADSQESVSPVTDRPNVYNRLIIKNGEMELLVEDTDTAINRSLGIVAEYGGYVVSNQTWIKDDFKYATLSIGVPSENFEQMLRRLKDLAVNVTNETVSGQDVTDEYVDLKSRLTNLEATAARIRTFLEQAETVEESLTVSRQLSEIEAEIEQVKGRMAYLKDRSAFSTITLQIMPQIPTPTPLPSPTPTMTPTPTPTPVPWSPSQTFDNATTVTSNAASSLFRIGVELVIWTVVVIVPFLLPLVAIIWFITWLARKFGSVGTPPQASA